MQKGRAYIDSDLSFNQSTPFVLNPTNLSSAIERFKSLKRFQGKMDEQHCVKQDAEEADA